MNETLLLPPYAFSNDRANRAAAGIMILASGFEPSHEAVSQVVRKASQEGRSPVMDLYATYPQAQ